MLEPYTVNYLSLAGQTLSGVFCTSQKARKSYSKVYEISMYEKGL